ncbi:hypothetical protein ILYODFUR_036672 [Ilyodon furcidens]|uniref:Uncharacterized protein n=1 Tax=Ilyodon furcidens TaxID=33524 RepID=A0ABV0SS47_9TELE
MTKTCKKTTYTHAFFCLAKRKDSDIPTPAAKTTLERAGLGERKITFPDKYCGASDFSDHLQLNFPQLKYCGGFQLLRSRGSTRSKVLEIIPCPQNGYTPEGLCSKELGVGAAVIYIRPLQKYIDMQDPPSLTLTPQTTGPLVECVYCAEIFSFSEIQGHNDCCEKKNNSDSTAEETLENTQAGTSAAASSSSNQNPLEENQSSSSEEWTTEPDFYKAANMFLPSLAQQC